MCLALQNAAGVHPGLAISIANVRAIAHQTAGERARSSFICRWNCGLCSAGYQLILVAVQKWARPDQQGVRTSLNEAIKSCFNFTRFTRLQNWSRHPECACCFLRIGPETGGRAEIYIDENGDGL